MVIKSKIYEYLKKYIGEYLYGFEKDQLEVALLSGNIYLRNVNFKPSKVNELLASYNLPIHIKAGLIGELQFKYHYSSALTNPLELFIDELLLIFGPICIDPDDPAFDRMDTYLSSEENSSYAILSGENSAEETQGSIDSFDDVGSEEGKASLPRNNRIEASYFPIDDDPPTREESILEKYFHKVIRNLTLHVKTVHIRYEDEVYPYLHPFAAGLCLESLHINAAQFEYFLNNKQEIEKRPTPKDMIGKVLQVKQVGLYMNSMAGMLIPTTLWEATKSSPIGIFSAFPASDVRFIVLEESDLVRNPATSLINPFDITVSLTIPPNTQEITLCGICDRVSLNLTSAYAECFRNFKEYYANIKLWGCVRKYRPYERMLLIPKTDDEPIALTQKRFKVVQKWFRYAFRFLREKRKLVLFMQKYNDELKAEARKVQLTAMKKVEEENLRNMYRSPPKSQSTTRNPAKLGLNAAVKEYNKSKQEQTESQVQPQHKREIYFPKFIQQSNLSFKISELDIHLSDNSTEIEGFLEVQNLCVSVNFMIDELSVMLSIDKIVGKIKDEHLSFQVFDIGTSRKTGLFGSSKQESPNTEKAMSINAHFRPGEIKMLNEQWPSLNKLEFMSSFSRLRLKYSINSISLIFAMVEVFGIDKYQRENLDVQFIEQIKRKKESMLTHKERFILKYRKVMHRTVLTKYVLTNKLADKLIQFQEKLPGLFQDLYFKIYNSNFNLQADIGGLELDCFEFTETPILTLRLGQGNLQCKKEREMLEAAIYSLKASSPESLMKIFDYFAGIADMIAKKVSQMEPAIQAKTF